MISLTYDISVMLFVSAHPFCLCMTMVVWFVTREHMLKQVELRMSRRRS